MNILHYTLGFPPQRSGGLVKYAIDLMSAEQKNGHNVYALYPGNVSLITKKSTFLQENDVYEVPVYQLTNALPVPLLYGIKNPSDFMDSREIQGFHEFIEQAKPDVVHIHTLMGLPKELLQLFKSAGIKLVFTTHDYFGLCPRVNFVEDEGRMCDPLNRNCEKCASAARGKMFLKLRNSKSIVFLKKVLK